MKTGVMSAPMQTLAKIVNWIIRLTGYVVGTGLILAVAALAIFGFTSFAPASSPRR